MCIQERVFSRVKREQTINLEDIMASKIVQLENMIIETLKGICCDYSDLDLENMKHLYYLAILEWQLERPTIEDLAHLYGLPKNDLAAVIEYFYQLKNK